MTFRSVRPIALFACLACLFLCRALFTSRVLVPAELLRYLQPWAASYAPEDRPPWNPLMYDSVGQFYPWRSFAARSVRAGAIPLWNPYLFCGTPFVGNSQSAVLYPGNLLYYLLPPTRAAGWTAALHLTFAAAFMWLFLRGLGASDAAGVVAGVAFAFSTWEVSWLELPTFLCTSCWLPLALYLTLRLAESPGWRRVVALGFALGLCLLGGHLQIAFYVLLAAALFAAYLAFRRRAVGWLALFALAVGLAFLLSGPQLLPTVELSRRSHRAGTPTTQGYAAYTAYAVPASGVASLFLPDYFGNPSRGNYTGTSRSGTLFNYAEGALYVGILTLLLAGYAVAVAFRRSELQAIGRRQTEDGGRTESRSELPATELTAPFPAPSPVLRPPSSYVHFLASLAVLALLMALGTVVDALLYFGVPGFGSSGSPGRVLVLWTFALAALAGLGLDALSASDGSGPRRPAWTVIAICAIGMVITLGGRIPSGGWESRMLVQPGLFLLGAVLVGGLAAGRIPARRAATAAVGLVTLDLFVTGFGYNLTAERAEVYPPTRFTDTLARIAAHDRILPVNHGWSFGGPSAVLPPNGALVYGLRDVQGYDSLFPGAYKAFMNRMAKPEADASPPEVGNMVFAKNPLNPLVPSAGVRCIVSQTPLDIQGAQEVYVDPLHVYVLTAVPGRAYAMTADGTPATVAWLEDEPDHLTLSVHSPDSAQLRLADEAYPGWHASIDGREVPVARDDVFRRVAVPAGRHIVRFEYRPVSFRFGLYLMLAALTAGAFTAASRGRISRE